MAKTQAQIDKIHESRTAKPGKIYTGPKGVLYVGSKKGHLIQESFLRGDVKGTTLDSKLDLGEFGLSDLVDLLEKEDDSGSDSGLTISGARKRKVTNSYLESNEVFMNESPFIIPDDCVLESISLSTKENETWTAEVHNDKVPIVGAALSVTGASTASSTGLNISIAKNSKLMLYVNGTGIDKPRVTIICKKPN